MDARIASGQLELLDHDTWYQRTGRTNADDTLRGWTEREEQALSEGYAGLRLTGNTYWVERDDWQGFVNRTPRATRPARGCA